MTPEQKLASKLVNYLDRLKLLYNNSRSKYSANDLRCTLVAAPGNTLRSYLLFFEMVISTVTQESWWKAHYNEYQPNELNRSALDNLDKKMKFMFLVSVFSQIANEFRKLVSHLSPGVCDNGNAKFKAIYDHILCKLNLRHYIHLYDLFREIRNSIHRDGFYFSKTLLNKSISWKLIEYKLIHGKAVDFLTHDLTLELYGDLIESLEHILNHDLLKRPTTME